MSRYSEAETAADSFRSALDAWNINHPSPARSAIISYIDAERLAGFSAPGERITQYMGINIFPMAYPVEGEFHFSSQENPGDLAPAFEAVYPEFMGRYAPQGPEPVPNPFTFIENNTQYPHGPHHRTRRIKTNDGWVRTEAVGSSEFFAPVHRVPHIINGQTGHREFRLMKVVLTEVAHYEEI